MEKVMELSPFLKRLLDPTIMIPGSINAGTCSPISRNVLKEANGYFDTFYAQSHNIKDGKIVEIDHLYPINIANVQNDKSGNVNKVTPLQLLTILNSYFFDISVHESWNNKNEVLGNRYVHLSQLMTDAIKLLNSENNSENVEPIK